MNSLIFTKTLQMGYVAEFIKHISKRSQIVAHQLIWNMQTNMYIDEEQMHKDGEFGGDLNDCRRENCYNNNNKLL